MKKVMNIPFSPPDVSELEIQYVADAMRSGWITTGPRTKELEKKLAAWVGTYKNTGKIKWILGISCSLLALFYLIGEIPCFLINNCFVGILEYKPIILRNIQSFLALIRYTLCASGHCSNQLFGQQILAVSRSLVVD